MTSKCIHVVRIGNYLPELWAITYPNIKAYADRIRSDLNIITTRKYPLWNVLYEKMQVYEYGMNYDHNFLLDMDVLIHKQFPDFSTICNKYHVGFNDNFFATDYFNTDIPYFDRDGRNVGIASNAVITCKYTHDLWTPLPYDHEQVKQYLLHSRSGVDEFALSFNLARYGLKYNGITWEDWQRYFFVHLGTGEDPMSQANIILSKWNSE